MYVDIHEAENNLSGLIDKANAGEEIIITKENAEVQLISKSKPKKKPFPFGILKGLKIVGWKDPLPPDIAEPLGMIGRNESST